MEGYLYFGEIDNTEQWYFDSCDTNYASLIVENPPEDWSFEEHDNRKVKIPGHVSGSVDASEVTFID